MHHLNLTLKEKYDVRVDADGWPEGLTDAQKTETIYLVKEILAAGPKPLWLITEYVRARWTVFAGVRSHHLLPYTYAVVERALAGAGADHVWILNLPETPYAR